MYCVGQLTMSYNTYTFLDDENEENKVKLEFLSLEKRKMEEQRSYREKKLALYEKMVKQQSEILELQKRSTIAVELLATKFQLQPPVSPPFSVSPVIRFDTSSCIQFSFCTNLVL